MIEQDRRSSISLLLRPAVSSRYSRMISRVGSLSGTYLPRRCKCACVYSCVIIVCARVRAFVQLYGRPCVKMLVWRQDRAEVNTNTLEVQTPRPKTAPAFTLISSEYLNNYKRTNNSTRINRGGKLRQQHKVNSKGDFWIRRNAYKKTSILLNPSNVSHWLTMPSEAPTLSFPASLLRSTQVGFPACEGAEVWVAKYALELEQNSKKNLAFPHQFIFAKTKVYECVHVSCGLIL